MSESLAVRTARDASAAISPDDLALSPVRDILDLFAARDRDGEILTAIRHFPARAAQWADFPTWTNANLRAAYQANRRRRSRPRRKKYRHRNADSFGKNALLQLASSE
jgi:hypothetical protein